MTPQLASRLTIHEQELAEAAFGGGSLSVNGSMVALPPRRLRLVEGGERTLPSLLRREALHRRLLGAADVLAATLALVLVLELLGGDQAGVAAVLGMPLVVVLFKVAGLYDRDELRLVHSTL